jgi:hypothetical protein
MKAGLEVRLIHDGLHRFDEGMAALPSGIKRLACRVGGDTNHVFSAEVLSIQVVHSMTDAELLPGCR